MGDVRTKPFKLSASCPLVRNSGSWTSASVHDVIFRKSFRSIYGKLIALSMRSRNQNKQHGGHAGENLRKIKRNILKYSSNGNAESWRMGAVPHIKIWFAGRSGIFRSFLKNCSVLISPRKASNRLSRCRGKANLWMKSPANALHMQFIADRMGIPI